LAYRNMDTTSSRNRLSDRDMLLDILSTAKSMSNLYDHAILESSNPMIREAFEDFQHDEHRSAEQLFLIMQQHGWYSTDPRQASGQRPRKVSSNYSNRYSNDTSDRYSSRSQASRNWSDNPSNAAGRNREGSNYMQPSWHL